MINNRQGGRRRGRGGQRSPNNPGRPEQGNRIDNRARGNASQLHEKYKTLARDAQMQGDRVNTEYYLQFADHYFRVLSESRARFDEQNTQRRQRDDDQGDEDDQDLRADDHRGNRSDQRRQRYEEGDDDGDQDEGQQAQPERDEQQEDRRPRRQPRQPRRQRDEEDRQGEAFDAAILPPAIARNDEDGDHALNGSDDADEQPAPRRRGRKPRAVEADGDAVAQA